MTKWRGVGFMGADDLLPFLGDDYEGDDYEGALQEQIAAMQEMGQSRQQAYRIPPPAAKVPKIALPPALARQMAKVPVEVFDIFPGYPNVAVSTALVSSTPNVESLVHTFTPPTGHYVVINPADITQEVLYEPYDSSTGTVFLKGLINIYTKTGLQGFVQRLYSGGSEFHNPAINISSVGNRRRWQFGAVISPGDIMETRFFHVTGVTHSTSSHLDHRVSVKKITP